MNTDDRKDIRWYARQAALEVDIHRIESDCGRLARELATPHPEVETIIVRWMEQVVRDGVKV